MRAFFAAALLLSSAALVAAAPQAPVPPQAPPIGPALGCRCPEGRACVCQRCDCPGGRPDVPTGAGKHMTFNDGYDLALATKRPLVTWISLTCPPCERELTGCVHVHAASLHGDVGPCVIVSLPEGGRLYRRVRLVGTPSAEAIRPWVLPPRPVPPPPHPWYGTVPPVSPVYYPAAQPVPFAVPAMSPMFFGGGFGGAACGPRG